MEYFYHVLGHIGYIARILKERKAQKETDSSKAK